MSLEDTDLLGFFGKAEVKHLNLIDVGLSESGNWKHRRRLHLQVTLTGSFKCTLMLWYNKFRRNFS